EAPWIAQMLEHVGANDGVVEVATEPLLERDLLQIDLQQAAIVWSRHLRHGSVELHAVNQAGLLLAQMHSQLARGRSEVEHRRTRVDQPRDFRQRIIALQRRRSVVTEACLAVPRVRHKGAFYVGGGIRSSPL